MLVTVQNGHAVINNMNDLLSSIQLLVQLSLCNLMLGVVVCAVESGLLIFSESWSPRFGLGNAGADSMQLASTLFAVYKSTIFDLESHDSVRGSPIVFSGDVCLYFFREESFLLVCIAETLNLASVASDFAANLFEVLIGLNISHLQSPRQQVIKALRDELNQSWKKLYSSAANELISTFYTSCSSLGLVPTSQQDIQMSIVSAEQLFVYNSTVEHTAKPLGNIDDESWLSGLCICWTRRSKFDDTVCGSSDRRDTLFSCINTQLAYQVLVEPEILQGVAVGSSNIQNILFCFKFIGDKFLVLEFKCSAAPDSLVSLESSFSAFCLDWQARMDVLTEWDSICRIQK